MIGSQIKKTLPNTSLLLPSLCSKEDNNNTKSSNNSSSSSIYCNDDDEDDYDDVITPATPPILSNPTTLLPENKNSDAGNYSPKQTASDNNNNNNNNSTFFDFLPSLDYILEQPTIQSQQHYPPEPSKEVVQDIDAIYKENDDNRLDLLAATTEKLIDLLVTTSNTNDPEYVDDFLSTFRFFTTPLKLINVLFGELGLKPWIHSCTSEEIFQHYCRNSLLYTDDLYNYYAEYEDQVVDDDGLYNASKKPGLLLEDKLAGKRRRRILKILARWSISWSNDMEKSEDLYLYTKYCLQQLLTQHLLNSKLNENERKLVYAMYSTLVAEEGERLRQNQVADVTITTTTTSNEDDNSNTLHGVDEKRPGLPGMFNTLPMFPSSSSSPHIINSEIIRRNTIQNGDKGNTNTVKKGNYQGIQQQQRREKLTTSNAKLNFLSKYFYKNNTTNESEGDDKPSPKLMKDLPSLPKRASRSTRLVLVNPPQLIAKHLYDLEIENLKLFNAPDLLENIQHWNWDDSLMFTSKNNNNNTSSSFFKLTRTCLNRWNEWVEYHCFKDLVKNSLQDPKTISFYYNTTSNMKSVQLPKILTHFDKTFKWVTEEILLTQHVNTQSDIIDAFILIARCCKEMKNYSTLCSICLALNHPLVRRLTSAWEGVSDTGWKTLEYLENFCLDCSISDGTFSLYDEMYNDYTALKDDQQNDNNNESTRGEKKSVVIPVWGLLFIQLRVVLEKYPGTVKVSQLLPNIDNNNYVVYFARYRHVSKVFQQVLTFVSTLLISNQSNSKENDPLYNQIKNSINL